MIGFASADVADKMAEFARWLNETGKSPNEFISWLKKPAFLTRVVSNPKRRQERLIKRWKDAPEKEYEHIDGSSRTTKATIDPDPGLRNQYTNDADQMICQICKEEMPFRKRDGEYYFEAVEALSKDYFPKEQEAQFLALCPVCEARYKEFVKYDESAMETLKSALVNSDQPEVPLRLGELDRSIRFVECHWHDIRTVLQPMG
jgi:hypothetical protein